MRPTLDFLLNEWLAVETLAARPRFADHSRETFDAVLDMCQKLAAEKFAPFNRLVDTEEPWFDGERVHLPEASHAAARAYAESGMEVRLAGGGDAPLLQGKLAACRYFFRCELPRTDAWLAVVASRDDTCRTMAEEWF